MTSIYKTDRECVAEIKDHHDTEALKTLVTRHSGIYLNMIHSLIPENQSNFTKSELIAEKDAFIYQCALDFNPKIKIKFSTFVGNRIKWKCLNLHNVARRRKQEPLETAPEPASFSCLYENVEASELKNIINRVLKNYPDKRANKIFHLRYIDGQKNKVMPWRKIAKRLDMSIQGCINIHNKLIKTIKLEYEQSNN